MTNSQFKEKLKELNACQEAIDWIGDRDLQTAWNECERVDWMLWLCWKMDIGTKSQRIHAGCDCAETALKYVPKGEDRPRLAIKAARRYADEPTPEKLEKLKSTADAAARDAAWAAYAAAWDATRATTRATTHKTMYDLIRKRITL